MDLSNEEPKRNPDPWPEDSERADIAPSHKVSPRTDHDTCDRTEADGRFWQDDGTGKRVNKPYPQQKE